MNPDPYSPKSNRATARPPQEPRDHLGLVVALSLGLMIIAGLGVRWWYTSQPETPAASTAPVKTAAHVPGNRIMTAATMTLAATNNELPAANTGEATGGGGNAGSSAAAPGNGAVEAPGANDVLVFDLPPGAVGLAGGGVMSRAAGVVRPVSAPLLNPYGMTMDANGNVYVADMEGAMHRIAPDGSVGTSSGADMYGGPIGATTDSEGNVIMADWQTGTVKRLSPDGTSATTLASSATSPILNNPTSVATDANGNIYVASNDNNTIVRIAPDGSVTTYAGSVGVNGAADGSNSQATFNKPRGLATDAAGDVFVADEGNSNIREIMPDGTVKTIAGGTSAGSNDGVGAAASFAEPRGLTVDSAGDIFVADTDNDTIRKITPDGKVTTIAGQPGQAGNVDGSANQALFNHPRGVSVDAAGNLYVTDSGNGVVKRIATDGSVTTVASPPAKN